MKPRRSFYDEANLHESIQLGKYVKAGCLTRSMLTKRISEDGGRLSDGEKQEYEELYASYFEQETSIQKINLIPKDSRTEKDCVKFEKAIADRQDVLDKIQQFELSQAALFEHCAENKAANEVILWWILNLSYSENEKDEKAVYSPLFEGSNFLEKRQKLYDAEDSEDEFLFEVIQKFIMLVTLWHVGKAKTKEDFNQFLKASENNDIPEEEGEEAESEVAAKEKVKKKVKKTRKSAKAS